MISFIIESRKDLEKSLKYNCLTRNCKKNKSYYMNFKLII